MTRRKFSIRLVTKIVDKRRSIVGNPQRQYSPPHDLHVDKRLHFAKIHFKILENGKGLGAHTTKAMFSNNRHPFILIILDGLTAYLEDFNLTRRAVHKLLLLSLASHRISLDLYTKWDTFLATVTLSRKLCTDTIYLYNRINNTGVF